MNLLNKIFKSKKYDKTDYLEVVKTKIFQQYSEKKLLVERLNTNLCITMIVNGL